MRTFLGMVLGCLLTIAVVYVHDVSATSTMTTGSAATDRRQTDHRPIVNWDVASAKWSSVTDNVRQAWLRLKENVS